MEKQRFLFLNYADNGGAGIANLNIAKALLSLGHEVLFLVANKQSNLDFVVEIKKNPQPIIYLTFWQRNLTRIRNRILPPKKTDKPKVPHYNSEYYYYNTDEQQSPFDLGEILPHVHFSPNIIIGGWISFFVNLEVIGKIATIFNAKAYVQMNDMAHLTGGCHYNSDCLEYTQSCEKCPALGENTNKKQSSINLQNKKKYIEKYNIEVIAGSEGNIQEARRSTLYKNQKNIRVINGILDFYVFNNKKRDIAKQVFDIPVNKKVIFSGANLIDDQRKGFDKMLVSLTHLNELLVKEKKEIVYIIAGSNNNFNYNFSNIEVRKMDRISDKILFSLLHQSADVYASPSVQDTGPVMVIQALASGTPVVGYQLGFVETFVRNNENGFVIPKFDTQLFAEKIFEVLYFSDFDTLSVNAMKSVKDSFSNKQFEFFFEQN